MDYWVYYRDDDADNGGVGVEGFGSEAEAIAFISARIGREAGREPGMYRLIRGREVPIEAVAVVRAVRVAHG